MMSEYHNNGKMSDDVSDDVVDSKYKKISKDLSAYIPELKKMLEDDLKLYLNASNAKEQEVLREFKGIIGRYFTTINESIRVTLLGITESMVTFEERCTDLYEDELETLRSHQLSLRDDIDQCDKAKEDLIALGTKIGVHMSDYEKEKSKFQPVKPDGVSYGVVGTLTTGAGIILQLVSKSSPAAAAASVAILLVGNLVLQYAQTKIKNIEYFVRRLVVILEVGKGIRDELEFLSEILGRLRVDVPILSRAVQANRVNYIANKARRISTLCNEIYRFKSRVGPDFLPLLKQYSEDNCNKAYDLASGPLLITQN